MQRSTRKRGRYTGPRERDELLIAVRDPRAWTDTQRVQLAARLGELY